jgi:hypothetical protein
MALPIIPIALGLANVVPGLLRLLKGDQAADVAEKVIGIARAVTGIEDPEEAVKAVQMDPASQIRLRVLALEEINAFLQDRQNARQREIEVVKATGKKDINLYILAWTVVSSFFTLVGILMFVSLPAENIGPVNQLIQGEKIVGVYQADWHWLPGHLAFPASKTWLRQWFPSHNR